MTDNDNIQKEFSKTDLLAMGTDSSGGGFADILDFQLHRQPNCLSGQL